MYGKDNSGPAVNVCAIGNRVMYSVRERDYGQRGRIARAPRDPNAAETQYVCVA